MAEAGRGGRYAALIVALVAGMAGTPSRAEDGEPPDRAGIAAAPTAGSSLPPGTAAAPVLPAAEEHVPPGPAGTDRQRRMMMLLLMNSAARAGPFGGLGR